MIVATQPVGVVFWNTTSCMGQSLMIAQLVVANLIKMIVSEYRGLRMEIRGDIDALKDCVVLLRRTREEIDLALTKLSVVCRTLVDQAPNRPPVSVGPAIGGTIVERAAHFLRQLGRPARVAEIARSIEADAGSVSAMLSRESRRRGAVIYFSSRGMYEFRDREPRARTIEEEMNSTG